MQWSETWGAEQEIREREIKDKVNGVVNMAMERAERAEKQREETVGLLSRLYQWCCGQPNFPQDAPVSRKIRSIVGGKKEPEVFTLLDTGQARIRSVMLDPQTIRMMVIDNRDGSHVVFTMSAAETGRLVSGLAQMWEPPKGPLDDA